MWSPKGRYLPLPAVYPNHQKQILLIKINPGTDEYCFLRMVKGVLLKEDPRKICHMEKNINIGQLMTTQVITVRPDETMERVAYLFRTNNIHHLPVVDENRVVLGMISKSDYYRLQDTFTLFNTEKSRSINETLFRSLLVEEVMVRQVAKLHPEDKILVAVGVFRENLFHAMPVVDKAGKLVGILSTYDLLNYAFATPSLLPKVKEKIQ